MILVRLHDLIPYLLCELEQVTKICRDRIRGKMGFPENNHGQISDGEYAESAGFRILRLLYLGRRRSQTAFGRR